MFALVLSRHGKIMPLAERRLSLPTVRGFRPYMSIIYPNLIYSISFHDALLLIK